MEYTDINESNRENLPEILRKLLDKVPTGSDSSRLYDELIKYYNEKEGFVQNSDNAKVISTEPDYNVLDEIEEGYYEVSLAGKFIRVNSSLCKILEYGKKELLGMNLKDLMDQGNCLKLFDAFEKVLNTGTSVKDLSWKLFTKDGKAKFVASSIRLIIDSTSKKGVGFRGIVRDITRNKKAYTNLLKSMERFQVLVENAPLGISLLDINNRYIYLNPKFKEMFGYTLEDIPTGREWFRNAHPDKGYRREVISQWFKDLRKGAGESRSHAYNVVCKNGSTKIIQFRPVTMETGEQIVFYADITELKNLEAQINQAQKIESLGTLAGGMAHNFNNLLMGIQGNSSIMLMDMDESHPLFVRLKSIEKLVQSGAELTRQLLGYARKGNFEIRPLNLNRVIRETAATFGTARKEVRIHLDLMKEGCGILADQGQMEQVLLNLYINAADAMPGGGDLYIKTKHIDSASILNAKTAPIAGDYILLTVRDTGMGMDMDVLERIFDPFFTTKGYGRGTGLGLSSVFGIIESHKGYIDVASKPDCGTSFYIYLPCSAADEEKRHVRQSSPELHRGKGTVLVVDDESIVREVVKDYLEFMGFRVLQAKGGTEALETYKNNMEQIDLVILDLIMPDMNGGDAYDRLKAIDPEIKVLLSSGYAVDSNVSGILERGCNGYIQKPFDMKLLCREITGLLEESSS